MSKAIISALVLAGAAGAANAATLDINLAGFQAFGGFADLTNTRQTFNLGPGGPITIDAVEFIGLDFTAEGLSWQSEFVISLNQSSDSGAAGTFWDYSPAQDLDEPGNFVGSGSFPAPSPNFSSGPFPLLADGVLLVYVYDTFNDAGRDAIVNAGTLRVTYTVVPAPAAVAAFGLAGLAGLRRRRA